jgi:hypothetical protein
VGLFWPDFFDFWLPHWQKVSRGHFWDTFWFLAHTYGPNTATTPGVRRPPPDLNKLTTG